MTFGLIPTSTISSIAIIILFITAPPPCHSSTPHLSKRVLLTNIGKVRGILKRHEPPFSHVEAYLGIKYASLPHYSFNQAATSSERHRQFTHSSHSLDQPPPVNTAIPWQLQPPREVLGRQTDRILMKFKPACPQPLVKLRTLKNYRFSWKCYWFCGKTKALMQFVTFLALNPVVMRRSMP